MTSDTRSSSKESPTPPEDQIRQDIAQLAETVNQLVTAQKENLKRRSNEQVDQLEHQVKEQPFKYLGIAFLGGFLAATLLSRK